MKTFKDIVMEAGVVWPGTPEYKKKFPETERTPALGRGRQHDIKQTATGVVATRRYKDDETETPEVAADGSEPVKRGRGRPPGKYGTYKKKVKEAVEVLDTLETDEEVDQFLDTLDEETLADLSAVYEEVEQIDEVDELIQRTKFVFNKTPAGKAREIARNREELKTQMRTTKSLGGLSGPKGKLPEEVEQVDEISQRLAARVYNKIAGDSNDMKGRTGLAGDQSDRLKDRMTKRWGRDATDAAIAKDRNTQKEEVELDEEQLDELSKGTVASYREKKGQRVMRDAMRAAVGDPTVKQPSDKEREMTKKNFDRAYDRLSGAKPTTPRKPFGAGAGNWVPRPGK